MCTIVGIGFLHIFIVGQVNTVLNPTPDDSDTEAILIVEGSDTVKLTKLQVICQQNLIYYVIIQKTFF